MYEIPIQIYVPRKTNTKILFYFILFIIFFMSFSFGSGLGSRFSWDIVMWCMRHLEGYDRLKDGWDPLFIIISHVTNYILSLNYLIPYVCRYVVPAWCVRTKPNKLQRIIKAIWCFNILQLLFIELDCFISHVQFQLFLSLTKLAIYIYL